MRAGRADLFSGECFMRGLPWITNLDSAEVGVSEDKCTLTALDSEETVGTVLLFGARGNSLRKIFKNLLWLGRPRIRREKS